MIPNLKSSLIVSLAILLPSAPAYSQEPIEPVDSFALRVANRVGVLRYCQSQGFASDADVADARAVLANDPQKPSADKLAQAEQEGVMGNILAGDSYITMASITRQSGFDMKETCDGIVAAAQMAVTVMKSD